MKKLEKIHIIDAPRDNMLSNDDLLNFLGGLDCTSYKACAFLKDTTCGTFDSDAACNGKEDAVKCSRYVD